MRILPRLYLKNKQAALLAEHRPTWFTENPITLAKTWTAAGAEMIFIDDLQVPATGKSEHVALVAEIVRTHHIPVVMTGYFRSLQAIEVYLELGVEQIILGAPAYQQPDFLKQVCQKFPRQIAVQIEVHNKKVVVPGMVAPSPKTAFDYAENFAEQGVAGFLYVEKATPKSFDPETLQAAQKFWRQMRHPVYYQNDPQSLPDIEQLAKFAIGSFKGLILGKPLYEDKIDLHATLTFLSDLAISQAQEPTLEVSD